MHSALAPRITSTDDWLQTQGIDLDQYLGDAIFLHYSGRKKPWRLPAQEGPAAMVESELAAPWLDVLSRLDLQDAGAAQEQLTRQRATKKERLKALLVTEPVSYTHLTLPTTPYV